MRDAFSPIMMDRVFGLPEVSVGMTASRSLSILCGLTPAPRSHDENPLPCNVCLIGCPILRSILGLRAGRESPKVPVFRSWHVTPPESRQPHPGTVGRAGALWPALQRPRAALVVAVADSPSVERGGRRSRDAPTFKVSANRGSD
jgi:hypothetical protein